MKKFMQLFNSLVALSAMIFVFVASCNFNQGSPGAVLKKFYALMKDGKTNDACALVVEKKRSSCIQSASYNVRETQSIKEVKIISEKRINENKEAIVEFKLILYGGQEVAQTGYFSNIKGNWQIYPAF